jgi:hypothetical protein
MVYKLSGNPKSNGINSPFTRMLAVLFGFAALISIFLYILASQLGIYFFDSKSNLPNVFRAPNLPIEFEHDFGAPNRIDSLEFSLTKKEMTQIPDSPFSIEMFVPITQKNSDWYDACYSSRPRCKMPGNFRIVIKQLDTGEVVYSSDIRPEGEIYRIHDARNSISTPLHEVQLAQGRYILSIENLLPAAGLPDAVGKLVFYGFGK